MLPFTLARPHRARAQCWPKLSGKLASEPGGANGGALGVELISALIGVDTTHDRLMRAMKKDTALLLGGEKLSILEGGDADWLRLHTGSGRN